MLPYWRVHAPVALVLLLAWSGLVLGYPRVGIVNPQPIVKYSPESDQARNEPCGPAFNKAHVELTIIDLDSDALAEITFEVYGAIARGDVVEVHVYPFLPETHVWNATWASRAQLCTTVDVYDTLQKPQAPIKNYTRPAEAPEPKLQVSVGCPIPMTQESFVQVKSKSLQFPPHFACTAFAREGSTYKVPFERIVWGELDYQEHCDNKSRPYPLELCWWYSDNTCCYEPSHKTYSEAAVMEKYLQWEEMCEIEGCTERCKAVILKAMCQPCAPQGLQHPTPCQSLCREIMRECSGTYTIFGDMATKCSTPVAYNCFNSARQWSPSVAGWWLFGALWLLLLFAFNDV